MPAKLIDGIIQNSFELGRIVRRKMLSADPSDLHMGQLHALAFIQQEPGITMTSVADRLQVSSPTATSFVARLVRMGYVTRHHDEKNRKYVRLVITKAGEHMLQKKMAEKRIIISDVLSVLSTLDQQLLLSLLKAIIASHERSSLLPSHE